MEDIISKLSKIEESSGAIMDQASVTKKSLSDTYAAKTAAWDAALTNETATEIEALKSKMQSDISSKLSEQQKMYDKTIQELNATYDRDHDALAQKLFDDMIRE